MGMFDERDCAIVNEPFKETNNVLIADVLEDRVEFKDIGSPIMTLKKNGYT